MEFEGQLSIRKHLTLGADPEIFVFANGKLLPAFEFLPDKKSGGKMYWDGFQAEWKYDHENNHCQNNLVLYTRENLSLLETQAKKRRKDAKLSLTNVVKIPKEILKTAHPLHIELGCQPSFNAYKLKGEPVYDPRELLYRFAGGHMHFGTWRQRPPYVKIVKTADSILGIWSVGVARNLDNPIRRKYYGLPGEYRMPMYGQGLYGVEYRTLSNWWLAAPCVMQVSWDIARLCVRLASSRTYGKLWAATEDEVINTIKNCDAKYAMRILDRNRPMFNWLLGQRYNAHKTRVAYEIARDGLESVIPNPNDFHRNWHFADDWIPDAKQPWARWSTFVK
jgi:hypothetical protein